MAFTPVWAQEIEVEDQGDVFLVTGRGHLPGPLDVRAVNPTEISGLDLFARFERYAKRQRTKKHGSTEAGIYQFADASDDKKLLAFIKEHGPVWGEVRSSKYDEDGICSLVVAQDRNRLRRQQEIFAAAVELLRQVNRNAKADLEAIVRAMARISSLPQLPRWLPDDRRISLQLDHLLAADPDDFFGPWSLIATMLLFSKKISDREKREAVLSHAHLMLCDLFNRYPPRMVPVRGQPIELPNVTQSGILEALYFKLRLDYQAGRAIGTCLHCGGHFPVLKRGARACGEACRRALRNQKYWEKHSKELNRNRRKHGAERK
jgi:hypothetical protein